MEENIIKATAPIPSKEKMYVVPVEGIIKSIAESKLDIHQMRYLMSKVVTCINEAPNMVREWIAQAILEQNGINVTLPEHKSPSTKKKVRNRVKQITLMHVVPVSGMLKPVAENDLDIHQMHYIMSKVVTCINEAPNMVRAWVAQAIIEQNGIGLTLPGQKSRTRKKKDGNNNIRIIIKKQ
jgi:BarA-like signal transduction histidine kinase